MNLSIDIMCYYDKLNSTVLIGVELIKSTLIWDLMADLRVCFNDINFNVYSTLSWVWSYKKYVLGFSVVILV